MPAVSSSPIATLSYHLGALTEVPTASRRSPLEVLEQAPDPRRKRGVRHRFGAILYISTCAVVSGSKSYAAIAEWAADTAADTLAAMGITAPNASTIRRALSAFTGDGFDTLIGGWLTGRVADARARHGGKARRRAIAVDGTAMRGSRSGDGRARMVMAALDHDAGVVLGQVEIEDKSNEIPSFSVLLDTIDDLEGVVVTADAPHAQCEHAEYLRGRGAFYILTVKLRRSAGVGW
ncbi:ISAs1 family transposase [Nocardia sp. SYP-A9097]|uniref:ISAs1 family transposase n=1 Tax=Nocardia sp. SYP-A9097 TaxID=2663237 RepID=UPI002815ECB1|nr:ISAs1 family transposase [Nocardia sp. SYP-A9097]